MTTLKKVSFKKMADENNEDDSWLYGSSNENQENPDEQPQIDEKTITDDPPAADFQNDTNQEDSRNDDYPEEVHVRKIRL